MLDHMMTIQWHAYEYGYILAPVYGTHVMLQTRSLPCDPAGLFKVATQFH